MSGNVSYMVDVRRFDEFSAGDLYALLKLRVDVFVVEQECPYPDLDGKDISALHMRLLQDGEILAAARIFAPEAPGKPARIGRVVVSPQHRGKRLGEAVMREAIGVCDEMFRDTPIFLSAQAHLRRFYGALGFEVTSDEYDEDGIAHVDMMRAAKAGAEA